MLAAVKRQQAKPLSQQKLKEKVNAPSAIPSPENFSSWETIKRGRSGEVVFLPRGFPELDRPTSAAATLGESAQVGRTTLRLIKHHVQDFLGLATALTL